MTKKFNKKSVYFIEREMSGELTISQALYALFGFNKRTAYYIYNTMGITEKFLLHKLTDQQQIKLKAALIKLNHKYGKSLKEYLTLNILKKKQANTYEGRRHIQRLPVRGQRTHTNAKTNKNKRK